MVKDNKRDKMILIDGNSLLNRAFFATPVFTTRSGLPTNGVFGFIKLTTKIISDLKPKYMVVAFDLHAPTFRHLMYDSYKAGRKGMPEELRVQVPVLKDCLSLMNIKICELEGYEADDIIGTLSRKFNVHSIIYTGDRDSYQLVNENTDVYFTKRGVTDLLQLTSENFSSETGLSPSQIIDLKSLMGDQSDNIPGVPGIGEKTAKELLANYHDLDNVYAHLDEITGATNKKLTNGRESAFMSKKLATIDVNVPIAVSLDDCRVPEKFSLQVKHKFEELEFKTFLGMDLFVAQSETNVDNVVNDEIDAIIYKNTDERDSFYDRIEQTEIIYVVLKDALYLFVDGREHIFPIKKNLLETGFFIEDFAPLFKLLFGDARKTVVTYGAKELMHEVNFAVSDFSAHFEDVSLMRYLVDSTDKEEDIDDLIAFEHLPKDKKAYSLSRLYSLYSKRMEEENCLSLYREIELPLTEVLYSMEEEGVCVEESVIHALSSKYDKELKDLSAAIFEMAGETFNINSPAQLGSILFDKMKLKGGKKGRNGKYSTGAEVLEKLAPESEFVRLVLRYRQVQKLKSTYLDGMFPLIVDGKIHTTYTQTVTSTGRLSSVNPNLQNIPVRTSEGRELRKLFVASKGNVLLDADYSQIELRLLAHFSGCKELIQAYNEGQDIHALTASQVFDIPLKDVTPENRRRAKAINFGILYGMSAFGLSQKIGSGVSEAKEYIDRYFERYSDVKKYMEENVEKAKKDGYTTTFTGRKRIINELKSSNYAVRSFGERAAMNMPLQGSSADVIKIAMIHVYRKLKEKGLRAKLILQVHDELIIDCPLEEKEVASSILKEEMENAVKFRVPLVAEVCSGNNWYEAKE